MIKLRHNSLLNASTTFWKQQSMLQLGTLKRITAMEKRRLNTTDNKLLHSECITKIITSQINTRFLRFETSSLNITKWTEHTLITEVEVISGTGNRRIHMFSRLTDGGVSSSVSMIETLEKERSVYLASNYLTFTMSCPSHTSLYKNKLLRC